MANTLLSLVTVVALSLIVSANSLDINVQPQFVQPNDENVVLTCSGGNNSMKMLEKMLRMRLMKLDDDDQWTEVAVLRFDGSIDLTAGNATAVGRLADVLESHLVVTWPVAPDDIQGRYRCDAIALTSSGDIVKEQSGESDVTSRPSDLSKILERLKKSETRLVEKINETMQRAMKSSKINLLLALDSQFGDLKEYLDNHTTGSVTIKRPEVEVETIAQWPEGVFTLLMPSAGCPLHPPAWIKSVKRMKAQSGDKFFPIDVPQYLAKPHKKNGVIYRQFCSLPDSPERTQPWPAGSYCLITFQTVCPPGFKFAEAKVICPSDKGNFYLYYYPNHLHQKGTFSFSLSAFCCRHDGNASKSIDLPVSHPFYLVRHGGRCQEVKGMEVTQDVFMMGTGDGGKGDTWIDKNKAFRPDVSFRPYKEDLCYYTRRRV